MSTLATNAITDASGGNTATINSYTPTVSNMAGRNKIINGSMVLDQRNAGASVAATSSAPYTVDRWRAFQSTDGAATAQQVSDAPAGFSNSLKWTTTTADASLAAGQYAGVDQKIEGFNTYDFMFGTSNAATITFSFWVKSSLTGNFGGALANSAYNRSYPFTYAINVANTWEQKTVTVVGDQTGTWIGATNGVGLWVQFGLGVGSTYSGTAGSWQNAGGMSATGAVSVIGTLNATWQITGVQLEVGSVATPFEHRQYGQELALCQRYYCKMSGANGRIGMGYNATTTEGTVVVQFPVTMRIPPTALEQSGTAADYGVQVLGSTGTCSAVPTFQGASTNDATAISYFQSGLVAGQGGMLSMKASSTAFIAFDAEL